MARLTLEEKLAKIQIDIEKEKKAIETTRNRLKKLEARRKMLFEQQQKKQTQEMISTLLDKGIDNPEQLKNMIEFYNQQSKSDNISEEQKENGGRYQNSNNTY